MSGLLRTLYDEFYEPVPEDDLKMEIETARQQLTEGLDRPARKLLLQIVDGKDRLAEELSIDSFYFGFKMACQLALEVSLYREEE